MRFAPVAALEDDPSLADVPDTVCLWPRSVRGRGVRMTDDWDRGGAQHDPRQRPADAAMTARRQGPEIDTFVRLGRCDVDLRARRVTCAGEAVELTAKEFDLLAYLAVRPGHVFSREQLLNAVWNSASEWQQAATVTEHVRRLRSKIEADPAKPATILTVRGVGYRLDLATLADAVQPAAAPPPEPGALVHVDGRIVFADDALGDLVGVADGSALVGRHIFELLAATSQAAAAERLADGHAGRERRSEIMQVLRSGGEQLTVGVASAPADWHGRPARRVQVTSLSDAPSRLRRIVTGILAEVADAVIITDLSFHIRSWNGAAERIYGWPEGAVIGRHVVDILQVPGNPDHAQVTEHLERTGRWKGTVVQATRDGSTVEILGSTTVLRDEGGDPIGVVHVNRPARVASQ